MRTLKGDVPFQAAFSFRGPLARPHPRGSLLPVEPAAQLESVWIPGGSALPPTLSLHLPSFPKLRLQAPS
ncbi:hypothetical protein MC885_006684, partial [Smutsia gigantea]